MESGGALNGSAAAGRFAAAGTAALAALMALLIAVTVAGNALVMLAFVADSSLRTQNNFFLLNLAISDFLVGKVPSLRGAPRPPTGSGAGAASCPAARGPLTRTPGVPYGDAPRHPLRSCPQTPSHVPGVPSRHRRLLPPGGSRGRSLPRGRVPTETAPSGCRCLLHSAVRALCADGEVDLREKPLQTLAGS